MNRIIANLPLFFTITLPLLYSMITLITGNPDFIIRILGHIGFVVWLIQWFPFLIGGWVLSIFSTIIFLAFVGAVLGKIVLSIITVFAHNK